MGGSKVKHSVEKTVEIPGPSALPLLGNILDIDIHNGLESLIGRTYGPIFGLTFGGQREIYVTNQKLTEELCDETRFCKLVCGGIEKLRPAAGDGLFTAHDSNHAWGVAHRILMPLFGPLKIKEMFPEMVGIAEQLCLKWPLNNHVRARLGASAPLDVSREFTRLTEDTIALCSMGYRFNSFYLDDKMHPFVESMFEVLAEADIQANLPDLAIRLRRSSLSKFKKNTSKLNGICKEIIDQRRENPVESRDLLNAMLNGRDPKTGKGLTEESVIQNMITFLIAGHETTSGLLSFAFYYLLENPDALKRAREEVDDVVGPDSLSAEHLHKLPYINSVLRETLRLMPTAPGFFKKALKDEVLGGKYPIKTADPVFVLLHLVVLAQFPT
ncbi:cytochrome P450 [Ilyonectria destructans]|nr:cytochrome P450 [Ilyonectria destructans]